MLTKSLRSSRGCNSVSSLSTWDCKATKEQAAQLMELLDSPPLKPSNTWRF